MSIKAGDTVEVLRNITRVNRWVTESSTKCPLTTKTTHAETVKYAKKGQRGVVQETFQNDHGIWSAKVLCEGRILTLRLTTLKKV